jgi:glycosyl transferase family 25
VHIHVISLDRTPERYAAFQSRNAQLTSYARFSAVEGQALDREALVREGIAEPKGLQHYSAGALGVAMSHLTLWKAAVEAAEPTTVCEDDAIFSQHFDAKAPSVLAALPAGWDLILWGWNFSPYVAFQMIPGAFACVLQSNDTEVRRFADHYRGQVFTPAPYRLIETFGLVCYTVSPKGARAMREMCLPLREMQIRLAVQGRVAPNFAIDTLLNAFYGQLNAYVCVPPLVVTRNDNDTSTASKFGT